MENFNKNLPFLTAIIGFGILLFSIFSFINGVKVDLNSRMDRVENKVDQLILMQAQRTLPIKAIPCLSPTPTGEIKAKKRAGVDASISGGADLQEDIAIKQAQITK